MKPLLYLYVKYKIKKRILIIYLEGTSRILPVHFTPQHKIYAGIYCTINFYSKLKFLHNTFKVQF